MSTRDTLWHLALDSHTIDGCPVLVAVGRVSHATSRILSEALDRHVSTGRPLIVDISGIDYISSAGFHVLEQAAAAFAARGTALVLCGMQETVRPAFELAGPFESLLLESTRAAAIARVNVR